MKRPIQLVSGSFLAGLLACACTPQGDLVELGVYRRDAQPPEASPLEDAGTDVAGDAPASDAAASDASEAGAAAPSLGDAQTLDASPTWVDTGAALEDASREAAMPVPMPTDGPPCLTGGCIGSSFLANPDPQLHCQSFTAHAPGSAEPYKIPLTPDHYARFTFKASNVGREYADSFSQIVDNPFALHHMRLYESHGEVPEGLDTSSSRPSALRMVFAWAPGDGGLFFIHSVGVPVEPNTFYTLEALYTVLDGRPDTDASGFKVCFTPTKPDWEVSISRLGRDPFLATSSSANCKPASNTSIHLLAVQAHMNSRGTRASLVLNRAGGTQEVVYDSPYKFGDSFLMPVSPRKLSPGDTLTASCYYNALSTGGPGIADEYCGLHVLHWPAHSLVSGGNTDQCVQ